MPTSPRRWLVIKREAGIPDNEFSGDRWSVDHLLLDQDAVPTFVEVKRASDTRARREVVAQMLIYAANASEYWPIDRMREFHASRCAAHLTPPGGRDIQPAGTRFGHRGVFGLGPPRTCVMDVSACSLWQTRFLRHCSELWSSLNRQMNPAEVLAVEIRQFTSATGANLRTLVPRVLGQTEQIRQSKTALNRDQPERQ